MRYTVSLLCLLAACSSPDPGFTEAERIEVVVEGTRFHVFSQGTRVEIIRTSGEPFRALKHVPRKAEVAIARATGCVVVKGSLTGDVALMRARLDC